MNTYKYSLIISHDKKNNTLDTQLPSYLFKRNSKVHIVSS